MRVSPFRPYVLNDSSAKMPSKVRAPYRHAAIIKTDGARDHEFVADYFASKIVEYSGKLHAGGKIRDAFSDWLAEAAKRVRELNDRHEIKMMTSIGCAPWKIQEVLDARKEES